MAGRDPVGFTQRGLSGESPAGEGVSKTSDLRSGPLSMALVGPDLRYVSVGDLEIVRRVYMVVRDLEWRTIPAVVVDQKVECRQRSFTVSMRIRNQAGDIEFEADLTIAGAEDGTIDYVMKATALRDCEYTKIGLNIHHPLAGVRGRPWIGHRRGEEVRGLMPDLVAPQVELPGTGVHLPMIPPVEELDIDQDAGRLTFTFGGDLYETEDQRNWADASYKTYSMPAEMGYRHRAVAGEEITQRVRISFEPRHMSPSAKARRRTTRGSTSSGRLRLSATAVGKTPSLGLGLPVGGGAPTSSHLRELAPAHIRADLWPGRAGWEEELESALSCCSEAGAGLELALHVGRDPRPALAPIERMIRERQVKLVRTAVLPIEEKVTSHAWVDFIRDVGVLEGAVGGGTEFDFVEVYRALPGPGSFEFLSWAMNPQVHAFSDLDLVENLDGQGEQLRAARAAYPGCPLCVGPVTLRSRLGVGGESLVDGADPRQRTRFTAAWTVGSIRQMAAGGAESVTYFETDGDGGVMEGGWNRQRN